MSRISDAVLDIEETGKNPLNLDLTGSYLDQDQQQVDPANVGRTRRIRMRDATYGAFIFGLIGAAALGWIMNIFEVFQSVSDPITGEFVLRCIGIIVAPLGAILGWM